MERHGPRPLLKTIPLSFIRHKTTSFPIWMWLPFLLLSFNPFTPKVAKAKNSPKIQISFRKILRNK